MSDPRDTGRIPAPPDDRLGGEPPQDALGQGRIAILDRIRHTVADGVTVVNHVTGPASIPSPEPPSGWRARRRWRAARRTARRRARSPERSRIEFTEWATLPWRDRPDEARLADVARDIADTIQTSPAWRHRLLDEHGVRLDAGREAADIACSAYRLYGLRRQLSARPSSSDGNPVIAGARLRYDQDMAPIQQTWWSLVDRVATLDSYRRHLDELVPVLAALDTLDRLDDIDTSGDLAGLFTATARNELAADDVRRLTDGVDGIHRTVTAGLGLLGSDVSTLGELDPVPVVSQPPTRRPGGLST